MAPEDVERGLLPRLSRVVEVVLKPKTNADAGTMKGALVATQAWLEAHQLEGDFKAVPLDPPSDPDDARAVADLRVYRFVCQ